MFESSNIAEYNFNLIYSLLYHLNIPHKKILKSSDYPSKKKSNYRLIELTKQVKGNIYMCGGGAAGYQDQSLFKAQNIELMQQKFEEKIYPQSGSEEFIKGLSIIDALMNLGFEQTKYILTGVKIHE